MIPIYFHEVPIDCINQAALTYQVPAKMILAVIVTEGGHLHQSHANRNGTQDLGPMQINSRWLSKLSPYGYTKTQLLNDPCANVAAGTWILSRELANSRSLWQGVGHYHSHTSLYSERYQLSVFRHYRKIEEALDGVDV